MPAFETNSPLRYPGGKAILSDFLAATIAENDVEDCTYCEPYAGGAGAAINLLLAGKVSRIILNDFDPSVWSFWTAILNHTDEFIKLVRNTEVTVKEWKRQRAIYQAQPSRIVELGFAAFFLNRCNRSGIMTNGGVIGGLDQKGKWKITARYNPDTLIERINRIAALRERIRVCNLDAIDFLKIEIVPERNRKNHFIYLDPPYFVKGSRLYLNYYQPDDHAKLASYLKRLRNTHWLVTYDNTAEIRALYEWRGVTEFELHYSAASSKEGSEIMIVSDTLKLPIEKLQRKKTA